MGLDMYAYSVCKPEGKVLPKMFKDDDKEAEELQRERFHYWRKHPNLHGFMEAIYVDEYGGTDTFNCIAIQLDLDHLQRLEDAIKSKELPETSGFFFGESIDDPEVVQHDLEFIEKARKEIESGKFVYYDSWW